MLDTPSTKNILAAIKAEEEDIVAIRRQIHACPETCFEEFRTAQLVADKLNEWGIETHSGIAKTGVVGTLKGKIEGKRSIALRADMDALFIEEQTGLSHRSAVAGKMHACGHDGHTAMLLGAARYLARNRNFAGVVNFIFQPAEEGGGGGRVMVEEGIFERFPTDAVYGMHNLPGLACGTFAIRSGAMLASADSWSVQFLGTGGHGGAAPHLATDPTIVQAHFVLALQSIVGRNVAATDMAVISVGAIVGGNMGSTNIIPPIVTVAGTARSYSPAVRDTLERRMREIAEGLAATYGCRVKFEYRRGYPALVNHPEQTKIACDAAAMLVGPDQVDRNVTPITASEDFSYMLLERPGAFILIGNGVKEDGSFHNVHTPHYDFNDEILSLGAAYWVNLVHRELPLPGNRATLAA